MEKIKMLRKVSLGISIALISSFCLPILSANAETPKNEIKKNVSAISGTVIDTKTQKSLKDVYVKQGGTLNTVLTDDSGKFSINIDPTGDKTLSIVKEGYESLVLDISSGQANFKVELFPALTFKQPDLPSPHSETSDLFNYSTKPISSNFSAMYQGRYQLIKMPTLTSGTIFSRGWAINELSINGQLRFNDLIGSLKIFRGRYPVDLENFEYRPVYNLDTMQFQLGGGKIFSLSDKLELYAGLNYILHFNTPDNRSNGDNKSIPFTNSYQDFPQTRQGPGVTGALGYMFNQSTIMSANATLYPVIVTTFDGLQKSNLGYHGLLDLGLNIKVETIPGIYVTGGYTNQLFFGFSNFLDDSNFLNFGVSLDPFKMASLTSSGK